MLIKIKQGFKNSPIRYIGLFVLIFGFFILTNYKDRDIAIYLLLGGSVLFFTSFLWLWVLSLTAMAGYFFIEFVFHLKDDLLINAIIDFFLIFIAVTILGFLTSDRKR